MKLSVKTLRLGAMILAGLTAAGILGITSLYFYLSSGLPSTETLKDVRFQVPLRVYSRDGKLLAEYGEMKRTPLKFHDIPETMVNAVLAAEDDRFFRHPGVDYQGLMRAAVNLLATGKKSQGGSTITMQVARNFFLSGEKTFDRKLREILLALRIEHELRKEEILELYLNKIYLGNRAYGIAAAAQVYYGKELKDLTLPEMAMLAGLPKAPSRYNPIAGPQRALERRNYVLARMLEVGSISQEQFEEAVTVPDTSKLHAQSIDVDAPYVGEMVRAEMVARFGEEAYTAGHRVHTTIDARLQEAANAALRDALFDYDRRHGYRGPEAHVELAATDPEAWRTALAKYTVLGALEPALVVKLAERSALVHMKDGVTREIPWSGLEWARRYLSDTATGPAPQKAADALRAGDIVRVFTPPRGTPQLAQIPDVEGALVSMDPNDGSIKALTGGYDFFRSKFNRAIQSARQPGSAFKPFVYSAALEKGFTPATVVNDAPEVFDDPGLETTWRPENYDEEFSGPIRLREALVQSRNLVSIRVLKATGIGYTVDYARRFGFDNAALTRNLSLALGSGAVSPLNLTAAYSVFANGGYRVLPSLIERVEDIEGHTLLRLETVHICRECETAAGETANDQPDQTTPATPPPAPLQAARLVALPPPTGGEIQREEEQTPAANLAAERVITPQNVYLMTSMMRDVIRRGTGKRALELGRNDLAGKTGTTNDQRDAWFAGFNTGIVTTVWVGFDDGRSLGGRETGGQAALPMWVDFMRVALDGVPERSLEQPPGIVSVKIDPETGLLAGPGTNNAIFEIFTDGTAPATRAAGTPEGGGKAAVPENLF